MKFYLTGSQENSLYHDALNFAGISDTSQFPVVEFTRNANNWYRKADSWIWEATGTWEFDDSNWTTLPIATTTLVASQNDYELPSTARKVDRIEVLDSNADYKLLKALDKSQIKTALSEFYETDGLPAYYDMVGRSIMLYPAPATGNVTLAAGLKVYYARDINEFAITDTNSEPGFDNHFHRIISLGAAYDYCLANGVDDRKTGIKNELKELKTELIKHYGFRHRDMKPRFIPKDVDGI